MNRFNFILVLSLFLLSSFWPQSSQKAPAKKPERIEVGEDEVLRVDTTLVGVPVTVLDRDGRFVPGLKQEDFHIYEDGVEQQIAYFAPVDTNVTVLLLFDKFVAKNFIKNYRDTARAFADRLGAGDKVLVAKFGDSKYEILTKVGDGPAGVQQEEKSLKWRFDRGIHDSIDAAIRRMNSLNGRKAIVLFSDGVFRPDLITVTEAMPGGRLISMDVKNPKEEATAPGTVNEAEESDAPIYAMQYDTMPEAVRQGPQSKYSQTLNVGIMMSRNDYRIANLYLHALTEKSGGRLYQVTPGPVNHKTDDPPNLAESFTQISAELRQQYSLGYYPKQSDKTKGSHQIKVRVARPDVVVRSRTTYVPMTSAP